MTTVAVTDLNAPAFPSFMEMMALPGGWVEPKEEKVDVFQISPFTFGQNYFLTGRDLSVFLNGPSDGNNVTVNGDVDKLVNHDGWYNDWNIFGNADSVSVSSSIGTSVSAYSADYASAFQSTGLDFSFSSVDDVFWNGVNDSSLDSFFIGDANVTGDNNEIDAFFSDFFSIDGNGNETSFVVLQEGSSTGDNTIEIGTLTGGFNISGGTLNIGESVSAEITIGDYAQNGELDLLCELLGICDDSVQQQTSGTSVTVQSGSVTVVDNSGDGSNVFTGSADDVVIAKGQAVDGETSIYNGGAGYDVFEFNSNTDAAAMDFEQMTVYAEAQGDVLYFGNPDDVIIQFEDVAIDFDKLAYQLDDGSSYWQGMAGSVQVYDDLMFA